MRAAALPAVLAVALALAIPGCSVEHHVTGPVPVPPPAADSPENAVRLFEWGWNHRELDAFRGLLTDDFRFVFAWEDSACIRFPVDPVLRQHVLTREGVLGCQENIFTGGGSVAPAMSVFLTLGSPVREVTDPRPGKDPKWHKGILTWVDLTVTSDNGQEYRVLGGVRFFMVRGDSAAIPPDLAAEGVGPDSTRWYLEQWYDEADVSPPGPALRVLPTTSQLDQARVYWGQILALYYQPPGAPRH